MARSNLGTLTLDLVARVGGFEEGLDKAGREAKKFEKEVDRTARDFERKFKASFKAAGLAATAALAGIAVAVNSTADSMADMYRAAQQVGSTTRQFTSLAYAAKTAQIPMEDLRDALSGVYGQIHNALTSATSDQAIAFQKLGVSMDDLKRKNSSEILLQIADGYKRLVAAGKEAEALRLGDTVMSDDFKKLIPLLAQGSEGIARLQKRAEKLGVAFGDVAGAKAAAFQKRIEDLKQTFSGLLIQVTQSLMPTLSKLADRFQHFLESAKASGALQAFVDGLSSVLSHLKEIALFLGSFVALRVLASTITAASSATTVLIKGIAGLRAAFALLGGPVGIAVTAVAALGAGLYALYRQRQSWNKIAPKTKRLMSDMTFLQERLNKATKDSLPHLQEQVKAKLDNARASALQAQSDLIAYNAMVQHQKALIARRNKNPLFTGGGNLAFGALGASAARSGKLDEWERRAQGAKKTLQALNSQIQSLHKSLTGAENRVSNVPEIPPYDPTTAGSTEVGKDFVDSVFAGAGKQITAMQKKSQATAQQLTQALFPKQALHDALDRQVADIYATFADTATRAKYIKAAAKQFGEHWKALTDDAKNATDTMSQYAIQAARNMQSAFANFLFDPFEDGLSGMLKGFTRTLRRMAANMLASKVFEALGSWGSANSGASGWAGVLAKFASAFGGGKAAGGTVQAGRLYRVNENRTELLSVGGQDYLMMGARNGRVIPGGTAQPRGGSNVKIVLEDHTDTGVKVERGQSTHDANGDVMQRFILTTVAKGFRAGGPLDQVMGARYGARSRTYG